MKTSVNNQYFIIGGTIKAATTSLFNYLSEHPQVCGSRIKETYFFSQGWSGDLQEDRRKYDSFFSPQDETQVLFEASPNYLAYKDNVAPRIKQLVPDARLLFILRNPVDRLYSYFNFAKGKLQLPESMSFEEYIQICEKFSAGEITAEQAGILETHLRALEIGNYGTYLKNFYDVFEAGNIKVVFFDELNKRPREILREICEFIGVSPYFFEDYTMNKANVTFSARMKLLHYIVLLLNRSLESVFRKFPNIKRRLVSIYKYFNQGGQGYVPMQDETRNKLISYYEPSNAKVKKYLERQSMPRWLGIE